MGIDRVSLRWKENEMSLQNQVHWEWWSWQIQGKVCTKVVFWVARGDYTKLFVPIACIETIRLVVALTAQRGWVSIN